MISFGSVYLELVFGHVQQLPRPGEEIFTDEFAISCGGAVTSASAAARSGVQAGLCTVLGDDLGSRVVAEHCAAENVDLSASARVHRRSAGITVVLNFDGDRAFVTHMPPRPATEPAEVDRWREVLRRERPAWCYLHAGAGVAAFLREARELGTKTAVDVSFGAIEHVPAEVIECVRLAEVFVPNAEELRRLTGQDTLDAAVAAATSWGTPLVVKRGAEGATVAGPDGIADVTAGVRRVEVRDLTGAGDSFAGAMIGARLQGASLIESVAAANAAGADAASRLGAVGEVEVEGLSAVVSALGAALLDETAATAATAANAGPTAAAAMTAATTGPTAAAAMTAATAGPTAAATTKATAAATARTTGTAPGARETGR
jgi:sugar/nucleoside kinase (ribokinase family)